MTAEHLTDGREPDLPVSDSLLRRLLFNLAAFREVPARRAGVGVTLPEARRRAATGRPWPRSA